MRASRVFGAALTASVVAAAAGQAPFTPGNLVVSQIYNGTGTVLAAAAAPIILVELNISSGAVVQSIPMPTAVSGANHILTTRGSSTSSAHLTRSVDERYLLMYGFDAPVDTAAVNGTSATLFGRVVGRIDVNGVIDTSTVLSDAHSANDPRAAASVDGTAFWLSGAGGTGTSGGPRYTTLGATTSIQLSSSPTNIRVINIFFGQLYESSASGVVQGVATVGTGLPVVSGQTTTLLTGFPTATGPSSYDFHFADASTVYVADDRTIALGGGVQKWTFDAGTSTWTLAYTLNTGLTNGCRGLTGRADRGGTTLYATTADAVANVVVVQDTGAGSAFTVLATSPAPSGGTQPIYRGIDFVPISGGGPVCYPNCDQSTVAPCLTVADFGCFLNSFAAASSYANCDGSTVAPVLTVADFGCFLNSFAAGCSGC